MMQKMVGTFVPTIFYFSESKAVFAFCKGDCQRVAEGLPRESMVLMF